MGLASEKTCIELHCKAISIDFPWFGCSHFQIVKRNWIYQEYSATVNFIAIVVAFPHGRVTQTVAQWTPSDYLIPSDSIAKQPSVSVR